MAVPSVSPVLPAQVLAGNNQLSSRKVFFSEEKATVRSFQGVMCTCSSSNHSFLGRAFSVERPRAVEVWATKPKTEDSSQTPSSSILCKQCEGNGAIVCSQCKGDGINKEDFFNGHFKAGSICWLCRGKRETLCGDCNGAGFIGGFMSSFED